MCLNHPALVQKHLTHLASSVTVGAHLASSVTVGVVHVDDAERTIHLYTWWYIHVCGYRVTGAGGWEALISSGKMLA